MYEFKAVDICRCCVSQLTCSSCDESSTQEPWMDALSNLQRCCKAIDMEIQALHVPSL